MAYIEGEGRNQGTLFPVVLDDLVPADHMCRVVDAFVSQLDMEKLGFERAQELTPSSASQSWPTTSNGWQMSSETPG